MEKKKLGLSDKSKLELSKTVGGGTVKQSFSHGRVKSVAVEVKKVRTFRKNGTKKDEAEKEINGLNNNDLINKELNDAKLKPKEVSSDTKDSNNDNNKARLQELKDNAQTDRIARENQISSTEEKNKKEKFLKDKKTSSIIDKKVGKQGLESSVVTDDAKKRTQQKEEDNIKKSSGKKNRADLKKQLSLGKVNIRR